ncbi:MAG TPA: hypothetical protein VJ798_09635 [Rhizomicrobium sp.]|nr:hypothetical protein [Rhizomicrobium sp.]
MALALGMADLRFIALQYLVYRKSASSLLKSDKMEPAKEVTNRLAAAAD